MTSSISGNLTQPLNNMETITPNFRDSSTTTPPQHSSYEDPSSLPENKIDGIPVSLLPPLSSLKITPLDNKPKTFKDRVRATGEKINTFLRQNWKYILFYILAWLLILACHHTVAITLTIWLGIGFGGGIVFGIFTANVLDRDNKYKNTNSIWNLISYGLQQLDPHGTRQILLATIVASISTLIYAVPQAVGFAIGACLGNQVSIAISYGLRLRNEDSIPKSDILAKKMRKIQRAINQYQLLKNQMIIQKQISSIAEHQKNVALTDQIHSIQLQINTPLPYIFDTPEVPYNQNLHFSDPDLVISAINARLLHLSQTLAYLKQDPNRIIEE